MFSSHVTRQCVNILLGNFHIWPIQFVMMIHHVQLVVVYSIIELPWHLFQTSDTLRAEVSLLHGF